MANYKLQEMTDLHNTGKRTVYPKAVINRTMDTQDIVKLLRDQNIGVSPHIIENVVKNLSDVLVQLLSMGYNVKLNDIGTFSLSLGFDDDKPKEMQGENDKMTYRHVIVKDMNFKADKGIVKRLQKETTLERCESEVSRLSKSPYTQDERIARALSLIKKYGFIDLQAYANINSLSRTVASQDLKKITAMEDSPIKTMGSGTHKVWVANS